ncbi:hypothetical protein [Smaragdicoccus niigatensis]|uniref:hypothetical protein n=1 Tax=Smaragdicoccus niigatensis TaxID=359359 RepID=UPI00036A699F|nr:hypothetical protein [Smaragdicoccus niigatensis]
MKSSSLTITTGLAAAIAFVSALLLLLSPSSVATDAVSGSVAVTTSVPAGDSPIHEGQDPALPGVTTSPKPTEFKDMPDGPGIGSGGVGGGSQQGPARPSPSRTR